MNRSNNDRLTSITKTTAKFFGVFAVLAVFFAGMSSHAANGIWTNAPVDATWTNINNWVGKVAPGQVNNNGNNAVDNSIATFNTPLASSIGGALNPIIIDDAVTNGTKGRMLGSILFSNSNCGPYVFYSPSPASFEAATSPEMGILNLSHNGSVTLSAEVTNSQTFLIPIGIRLPSSTAGIFNLINNSTNNNAVLFFNAISNHSANTRGTTLVLSGSNTGTNTVGLFSKGSTTTGAMGLTKQGTGTWILPNNSDWNSAAVVTINNGTLIVRAQGVFGSSATATVVSNGVLQLDGVSLTNVTGGVTLTTVLLQNGGTLRMNGSGTNNIRLNTAAATSATVATTGAGDVLTINTNSGGAADTVLHVSGPGTVFLANTNAAYVGSWSMDAGTVQVGNNVALGSGQSAIVGAGAVLDFSPLGAISYNPSTAGIGGKGTGTSVGSTAATIKMASGGVLDLATGAKAVSLNFAPTSFSGDTTHPALYISQGTLSLNQNQFTVNNTSGTPLGLGTYRLVEQAGGSIADGGGCVAIVSGSGTVAGTVGLIQVSGGNVNLVVLTATALNLVWQGGHPNSVWDSATTINWLNGGTPSVFNPSDSVTFNAVGSTNPVVTLSQTLLPNHVTVDTSANNYTFTGSGVIAGNATLAKISSGTLLLQAKNTYNGGTVVSNGTLRVGIDNALPVVGAVTVKSPAILDLNTFSNIVGSLGGDGVVDNQGGGVATLIIGNNNSDDSFSGVIQNTSGTLGLTKVGTGIETITGANTYSGPTIINNGTLRVGNAAAISASPVTLNVGTLDVRTSITVTSLVSLAGSSIANNSSATTNIITFTDGSTNISSVISDGTGGGGIGIYLKGGNLQLNNGNTYSGGTVLASGTTLSIGSVNGVSSGNAGTGSIIASNGTTVALNSTVSTSSQLGSPITTVDGATVLFTGAQVADQFNGLFNGGVTATNIYGGNMSIGGTLTFSNFLGVAVFTNISPNAVRFNNTTAGGDSTIFEFRGGGVQTRDATVVRMGALRGNGGIYGPSVTAGASYWIGALGIDTEYSGSISGSNNIVKTGIGRLTLSGGLSQSATLDQDLNLVTNTIYANTVNYVFATTISNGVLALSAPALLTNSSVITLASATAVLDASKAGYGVNEFDENSVLTNKYLVTNGVFEVLSGHTLAGVGTIRAANVLLDSGSTFNIGLPLGSLTVTNTIWIGGLVNVGVNATNSPNSSRLVAQGITIDSGASLVVTNLGSENAATFQLFNHPVSFTSVTLPVLSGTNTWINNLAVDGSLTLVAPVAVTVNTNSTNIVVSASGGSLVLSWPTDHTGWRLQSQTNSLTSGIGTNWVDVAGSVSTNQVTIPVSTANGSVFFRLVYP